MRGKDHLFYLIKSLSKSEKRYFTLDAKKSGRKESRYLELFKAVNQQSSYDEQSLKTHFGRKLADDKGRLYEAILRSMRDYQSHKSYKARIKELLTDAKILFERKLYEQSGNRLEEAKSLALELQDHLAVLEINLEQRQLTREVERKQYADKVVELIHEKDKQINLLNQQFWVQDNFDKLSIDMLQNPQLLNEKDQQVFQQKYEDLLNMKEEEVSSFFTKRRLHQCRAVYYRLTGAFQQEYQEFEKTRMLWQDHPKNKQEYYHLYLVDAINLLAVSMRNPSTIKAFPSLITEIKQEKTPSPQASKILFERTTSLSLFYLSNNKERGFEETVKDIEMGLQQYDITVNTRLSIYINLAVVYFLNDRFEACLKWTGEINKLTKSNRTIRIDIQQFNQIIQLMAIHKLDDYEETENAIRRASRFFAKQRESNTKAFALLIITTLKGVQASISTREENAHLDQLKDSIAELSFKLAGGLDEISQLWIASLRSDKEISELR